MLRFEHAYKPLLRILGWQDGLNFRKHFGVDIQRHGATDDDPTCFVDVGLICNRILPPGARRQRCPKGTKGACVHEFPSILRRQRLVGNVLYRSMFVFDESCRRICSFFIGTLVTVNYSEPIRFENARIDGILPCIVTDTLALVFELLYYNVSESQGYRGIH
jgi:hypothetical protein